jgi:hypothetical protein
MPRSLAVLVHIQQQQTLKYIFKIRFQLHNTTIYTTTDPSLAATASVGNDKSLNLLTLAVWGDAAAAAAKD